mmetsp:Transcript_17059/g.48737  ORF Transcript_17059/g.48737 Transcript_17059/m.48737 type:complete len:249 (+) Transcript_17059:1729-2475(+)
MLRCRAESVCSLSDFAWAAFARFSRSRSRSTARRSLSASSPSGVPQRFMDKLRTCLVTYSFMRVHPLRLGLEVSTKGSFLMSSSVIKNSSLAFDFVNTLKSRFSFLHARQIASSYTESICWSSDTVPQSWQTRVFPPGLSGWSASSAALLRGVDSRATAAGPSGLPGELALAPAEVFVGGAESLSPAARASASIAASTQASSSCSASRAASISSSSFHAAAMAAGSTALRAAGIASAMPGRWPAAVKS